MIWVIAGTKDARELINFLAKKEFNILATCTTKYGERLIKDIASVKVIKAKLSKVEMINLIKEKNINTIIDVSHPFASEVSNNAIYASRKSNVKYIRFERESTKISETKLITRVKTFKDGAKLACKKGSTIFLTIGSNNLHYFVKEAKKTGTRIIARILPDYTSLKKCIELGLTPKDIIAIEGPLSYELNKAMFKEYKVDVLVTKDSGELGGVKEKIKAALSLKIDIILIEKPVIKYPLIVKNHFEVLKNLNEKVDRS